MSRKLRINPINGEPMDQTGIRIAVATERVKREVHLLRIRSRNSQKK